MLNSKLEFFQNFRPICLESISIILFFLDHKSVTFILFFFQMCGAVENWYSKIFLLYSPWNTASSSHRQPLSTFFINSDGILVNLHILYMLECTCIYSISRIRSLFLKTRIRSHNFLVFFFHFPRFFFFVRAYCKMGRPWIIFTTFSNLLIGGSWQKRAIGLE